MLDNKKITLSESTQNKNNAAFFDDNYIYKSSGGHIVDLNSLEDEEVYEIRCIECGISIRSQGCNIKNTYRRLTDSGCIGCGKNEFTIKHVNIMRIV